MLPVTKPDSRPRGIKYVSLWEKSGYGEAAYRQLRGLIKSGIPITWTPMILGSGWGLGWQPFTGKQVGDPELDPYCNRHIDYDVVILHLVPEYFPIWSTLENGKRVYGYTTWETDRLPQHWPKLFDGLSGIFVPCKMNKTVFQQSGTDVPIHILPHIALPEDALSRISQRTALPLQVSATDFVFYSINAWTTRKALRYLIKAYLEAFSADDNVVLALRTSRHSFERSRNLIQRTMQNIRPPETNKIVEKLRRAYQRPARIELLHEELTHDEILRLHQRGDCYVSLTRGEGWGVGAFDAGMFGKPVIMTGYGGQRDFLPASSTYFVDYRLVPVDYAAGEPSYTRNQLWAEPSRESAVRAMREVFETPEAAKQKGARLQQYISNTFQSSLITEHLIRSVSE